MVRMDSLHVLLILPRWQVVRERCCLELVCPVQLSILVDLVYLKVLVCTNRSPRVHCSGLSSNRSHIEGKVRLYWNNERRKRTDAEYRYMRPLCHPSGKFTIYDTRSQRTADPSSPTPKFGRLMNHSFNWSILPLTIATRSPLDCCLPIQRASRNT